VLQAALDLLDMTEDQLMSFDPAWRVVNEAGTPCPAQVFTIPRTIATRQPVCNIVLGVSRSRGKTEYGSYRTLNRDWRPMAA